MKPPLFGDPLEDTEPRLLDSLKSKRPPAFPPGVFVYLLAPDQAGTPLGRSAQFHELNKGGLYQRDSSVEGGSRKRNTVCSPGVASAFSLV